MAVWSGIHACVRTLLLMHVCVLVCCVHEIEEGLRGRSLYGHEYQCSRKRLLYILTNPWILLSKCLLFASNKLSESLFSPCFHLLLCAYWVSLIRVCLNFHWLPLTNTSLNFHHSTSSSSLFIWPAVHSLARQCCALNSTVLAASSCSDDPLDAARVSS